MPLYEYACSACGHADTLLGKPSSARKRKCPECGKLRAFERQISAPAFHLKGDGWYVTDFRDNSGAKGKDGAASSAAKEDKASAAAPAKADSGTTAKDSGDAKKAKDTKQPAGKDGRSVPKAD